MHLLITLFIGFLLGLLAGWWFGRHQIEEVVDEVERSWRSMLDDSREELEKSWAEAEQLSAGLESSRGELESSRAQVERLSAAAEACEQALARSGVEPAAAADLYTGGAEAGEPEVEESVPAAAADLDTGSGRDVEEGADDLKIVDGIGPKIESLLVAGGIRTWAQLAAAEVSRLRSILDHAGRRFRVHDPGTWPRQAALAAAGSWDELQALQGRLEGGRET